MLVAALCSRTRTGSGYCCGTDDLWKADTLFRLGAVTSGKSNSGRW